MVKKVLFGKESRDKLLIGVRAITDAVRVTMGAAGKCVLIGESIYGNDGLIQLPTIVTKDGYNVTRYFQLEDVQENRGAMIIKEAALKTVEEIGDATTLTCVLAEALISGGMDLIEKGANSQELKKGMDKALEYVVLELQKISTPARNDNDRIRQIATVSANNDSEIGDLIADAFKEIGDDGVIEVESSHTEKSVIKIANGFKINRGWESPLFINDRAKEETEYENPLILLYDKKILHHKQVEKVLQISIQQQRPLLIICEGTEEEGLAYLGVNNYRGNFRVCVVKSPDFGIMRSEGMEDIALFTGASYVSDLHGLDLTKVDFSNLGQAKKVIVSKAETVIIEGNKNVMKFEEFIDDLRMNQAEAKTEDEKYAIEKRIARLNGSVAVIQMGAATETELKEKMDRVDDAVRATKAAISEGFVAGGGTALLRIPLPIVKENNLLAGYNLVFDSLETPLKQICENAGVDSEEIYQKVKGSTENIGYNVLTDKIEDLVEAGIIDSTKAIRCALKNAVSVAGMILTSEASIITTH